MSEPIKPVTNEPVVDDEAIQLAATVIKAMVPEVTATEPAESTVTESDNQLLVEEPEEQPTATEEVVPEVTGRKQQKALQEFDINSPVKLTTGDEIILPATFDKETREVLERLPNVEMLDSPEARDWAQSISEGLEYTTFGENFVPTMEDPNAEFRHKVEHNGMNLTAQSPKFKETENQNLKGERAVIRVITHLGLGTLFQVPLWHSGLWITFKPPTESEIIELNRILIADKIKFGRYTYGLAFSNITVYTVDRLVDFALSHVYDTTSKSEDIPLEKLKNHISCQDIPSLLWGFICTMYPRGFKYRRACINDPLKCNHILQETLNVTKLQWTNTAAISEWQKSHMSGRQSKVKDLASVNRYKDELVKLQKKKIVINKDTDNAISVTLKTPSITDYVNAGHVWIGDIVETVDKAVAVDSNTNERNEIIKRHGQASAMRQYSHWVDSIEIGTNIIDDKETIEKTLNVLSADDDIRNEFINNVVEYINQSTVSVIGIPVYECPNCGMVQETTLKLNEYKNIIPLDVIQVFFGLITQRLNNLNQR